MLSFSTVNNIGDILSTDHYLMYFPHVPTIDGFMDGKDLTLRHGEITLPNYDIGAVQTKIYGWSRSFAGRRTQIHEINISFYETQNGEAYTALFAWHNYCAGFRNVGGRGLQKDYSVDCILQLKDSTLKIVTEFLCLNTWVKTITPPPSTENSAPYQIDVVFSTDAIDSDLITGE